MTVAKTGCTRRLSSRRGCRLNCLIHKEDNMTVAKTEAAQDWAQEEAVG